MVRTAVSFWLTLKLARKVRALVTNDGRLRFSGRTEEAIGNPGSASLAFSRLAKNSERADYRPPFAIKPTFTQSARERGAKVIETYGPVVYV